MNIEVRVSGLITQPICNLGESSYFYIYEYRRDYFLYIKSGIRTRKNGLGVYLFTLQLNRGGSLSERERNIG